MSQIAATYTMRLCKNGVEFRVMPNVVEDDYPRPQAGWLLDAGFGEGYQVIGVIRSSASERVVDVEDAGNVAVPSMAGDNKVGEDPHARAAKRAASIPAAERCPACGGTGDAKTGSSLTLPRCPACSGNGRKTVKAAAP